MHASPRPTLETVAARASVSRQTVSNALNAPHLVRADTLERVLAVIGELDYHPHGAARQLRTNRSHVIGLRLEPTIDGISGALLDRFLHALTEQAQLRGYRVMLFTAADDHAEIDQYNELLDVLQLDAFVLTSTHHGDPRTQWLSEHAVPFVTFGRAWRTADETATVDHAWVDVDGAAGTQAAVEHLIERGHRKIGFIGWPDGSDSGDDRRAGWQRAMLAADVVPPRELDALCARVMDGVGSGATAAEEMLAGSAPTAFVCASDSLALGTLVTARALGRSTESGEVPAVVGFDDTPVARAIGMSSVAQPLTEAAEQAFALLLAELRSPAPHTTSFSGQQILLTPTLVVRDSSAQSVPPLASPG